MGGGGPLGGGGSFVAVFGGAEGSWLLLALGRRLWCGGDLGGGKSIFKPRRLSKSWRSSVQWRCVASRLLLLCCKEVDVARPPRV